MRNHVERVRAIGVRRLVSVAVVLVIGIVASLSGYIASRQTTNQQSYFGDFDNPDRVEVTAWITKVDSSTQALSVTLVHVRPYGALAVGNGSSFADDAAMLTNAVGNWQTTIKAGEAAPDAEQRIQMNGAFTNYPFDHYLTDLEVHLTRPDGTELPVALTLYNTDPFFQVSPTQLRSPDGTGTVVGLDIHRSTPTLVFAVFIMVLMLGLAAAAVVAGYYVLHWKRGLIFPACSMMAAILFALIPLRNAVPGNPPIGSIIDFGSFFIAEAVISISLISGVLLGFRHQLAIEREDDSAEEP
ncbi:DUF4436 family protein [Mycolicibacterium sp. CBM1]